jgi:hypothetical protein
VSVSWADYQVSLAAYWLVQGRGGFFLRASGEQKARVEDSVRSGVLARMPDTADKAALSKLGEERQLQQYPTLTDAQFAAKLKTAFEVWTKAGTPDSVLSELMSAIGSVVGLSTNGMALVTANGRDWATPQPYALSWFDVGGPDDLDGTGFFNRFLIYIIAGTTSPGSFPDGCDQSNLARGVVARFKAGHSKLARFVVVGTATKLWGGFAFTTVPITAAVKLLWGGGGLTWDSTHNLPVYWAPPENQ